jgi:uncharacterized protein (TIGR00730 family)
MKLNNITIYLGSANKAPEMFKQATRDLAHELVRENVGIVYGGMSVGLMGILADTGLKAGGTVLGVIPTGIRDHDFVQHELIKTDRMIVVEGMWHRKKILADQGDAAIALAGGYGTIDEVFEYLYWIEQGWMSKPILLFDQDGYWQPLFELVEQSVDSGRMGAFVRDYLLIESDFHQILPRLQAWKAPDASPSTEYYASMNIMDQLEAIEYETLNGQGAIIIAGASVLDLYRLSNALVMKQLGKHARPIFIMQSSNIYPLFRKWAEYAAANYFITQKCLQHFMFATDTADIDREIAAYQAVQTDLLDKWL